MANNRMSVKCPCGDEVVIASGLYPWRAASTLSVDDFDRWLSEHTLCSDATTKYGNGLPTHFTLEYEVPGEV